MVENDTLPYHVKKTWFAQEANGFNALINQERTSKLELIAHLITHSTQALMICGLEHIDKSSFLKDLKQYQLDSYHFCQIQGNAHLTFNKIQEQVQEQVVGVIKPSKQKTKRSSVSTNNFGYFVHHKKTVLLIDDAGNLAAGLIDSLITYVSQHPFLRVVFILTHDEFDLKNNTEPALLDCCLIEIQSDDNKDSDLLKHEELTSHLQEQRYENITENLYLESQLIAGSMISKIPAQEGVRKDDNSLKILIAAVIGLIALALGTQWFSASKYNLKDHTTIAQDSNSSESGPNQPVPFKAAQN